MELIFGFKDVNFVWEAPQQRAAESQINGSIIYSRQFSEAQRSSLAWFLTMLCHFDGTAFTPNIGWV